MSDDAVNVQILPKHTPGPWHATTSGGYVMAGYAAGGYPIARMDDLEAPHVMREGNARLVAAAPDLLAALEGVMTRFGGTRAVASDDPIAVAARAAIARVRQA